MDIPITKDAESDYEDYYVAVELDEFSKSRILDENHEVTVKDIDTPTPTFQIGEYLFRGEVQDALGTIAFFKRCPIEEEIVETTREDDKVTENEKDKEKNTKSTDGPSKTIPKEKTPTIYDCQFVGMSKIKILSKVVPQ